MERSFTIYLFLFGNHFDVLQSSPTGPIASLAFNSEGVLYGWDESQDDLVLIDKTTAFHERVGESFMDTAAHGMAFDDDDVLHFLNVGGRIYYAIDTETGAGSFQQEIDKRFETTHGDIMPETKLFYQSEKRCHGTIEVVDLDSLRVTSTLETGIDNLFLVAFKNIYAPTVSPGPTTTFAPSSLVSVAPSEHPTQEPTVSPAPTSFSERILFGAASYGGTNSSLYSINTKTGRSTFIGPVAVAGIALALNAMAWDPTEQRMYIHTRNNHWPFPNTLFTLDLKTAKATRIGVSVLFLFMILFYSLCTCHRALTILFRCLDLSHRVVIL